MPVVHMTAQRVALTVAESEVVEAVAKGWDYPTIADWLGISQKTARVHVSHIVRKLPPHGGLKGYARVLYWTQQTHHQTRSPDGR